MVRDGSGEKDKDWAEAFGTVVGRLMAERDTTAYRIAGRIGRPVNTVNRYYLGQRVPPATVLVETALALAVGVEELVAAVGAVAERLHAERQGGAA